MLKQINEIRYFLNKIIVVFVYSYLLFYPWMLW